jgi:homoserine O-acetyltransferase
MMPFKAAAAALAFAFTLGAAQAADFPAPQQGEWTVKDFKFHSGETMPVKLHYTTVGAKTGEPVLVLHGSGGSAASMLTPAFAGELYGPGQPLDASKYYIIIPDSIGLGIKHLRLVIGNSMGGMQTFLWGEMYPGFMDALAPMAAQPTAMASRNWMLRRMMLEAIRNDPGYKNGNYSEQPRYLKIASVFFGIATAGGTQNYQKQAPTNALANAVVDKRLAAPMTADANDFLWAWGSSADYDAAPNLGKIQAQVLAINAADDERNPPETGIMEKAMKQVKHGRIYLIPASAETSGHSTTGNAKFYKQQLEELLKSAPHRAM